ncbi:MAG TPA: hypothetical protein VHW65_09260 [Gemmatimonadales bacterium]|jgi:hypothetical protein|nr:hypothetical protein [Gemmatimonadales bacterium]
MNRISRVLQVVACLGGIASAAGAQDRRAVPSTYELSWTTHNSRTNDVVRAELIMVLASDPIPDALAGRMVFGKDRARG